MVGLLQSCRLLAPSRASIIRGSVPCRFTASSFIVQPWSRVVQAASRCSTWRPPMFHFMVDAMFTPPVQLGKTQAAFVV